MEHRFYKFFSPHTGDVDRQMDRALEEGYNGLQGPLPLANLAQFRSTLESRGLSYVATIAATDAAHLELLMDRAVQAGACVINVQSGLDSMTLDEGTAFFEDALKAEQRVGVRVAHETCRGRLLFGPWVALTYLRLFPEIWITANFAHWTVVSGTLLQEHDQDIWLICTRAAHVHAVVGGEHTPQLADPRAPESGDYLRTFSGWWDAIQQAHLDRNDAFFSVNPELIPALAPRLPNSQAPVVDPAEVSGWMLGYLRERWTGEAPRVRVPEPEPEPEPEPAVEGPVRIAAPDVETAAPSRFSMDALIEETEEHLAAAAQSEHQYSLDELTPEALEAEFAAAQAAAAQQAAMEAASPDAAESDAAGEDAGEPEPAEPEAEQAETGEPAVEEALQPGDRDDTSEPAEAVETPDAESAAAVGSPEDEEETASAASPAPAWEMDFILDTHYEPAPVESASASEEELEPVQPAVEEVPTGVPEAHPLAGEEPAEESEAAVGDESDDTTEPPQSYPDAGAEEASVYAAPTFEEPTPAVDESASTVGSDELPGAASGLVGDDELPAAAPAASAFVGDEDLPAAGRSTPSLAEEDLPLASTSSGGLVGDEEDLPLAGPTVADDTLWGDEAVPEAEIPEWESGRPVTPTPQEAAAPAVAASLQSAFQVPAAPVPPVQAEPAPAAAAAPAGETAGVPVAPAPAAEEPPPIPTGPAREITVEDIQRALDELFREVGASGESSVSVVAGDLHERIAAGDPRIRKMPETCRIMRRNMRPGDAIIDQPRGGEGPTLAINYKLPR